MNKKGGNVIRIVLGVYLIYLGVNIFIEVVQKNPANSGFMGVAGGIFVIVGAVYAFLAAKKVFAEMKKEKNVEEELSVSEADGNEIKWQEAEISHAKKESKGPVMVEAGPDRNERKEAEKENKVNTGEKIADKERADKEKVTAEKKAPARPDGHRHHRLPGSCPASHHLPIQHPGPCKSGSKYCPRTGEDRLPPYIWEQLR